MKRLITICLLGVLLSTAAAWGNTNIAASFDKNGNGYVNGAPLQYAIWENPKTLVCYGLPQDPHLENIKIIEPVATDEETSYASRLSTSRWHTNKSNVSCAAVFVFSDLHKADETGSLAGTGISMVWISDIVQTNEVGDEGWNGGLYAPMEEEPEYISDQNLTYVFTSNIPHRRQ